MENLGSKKLAAAAVITGVVIGAGSVYLYCLNKHETQCYNKYRKLSENMRSLGIEVEELKNIVIKLSNNSELVTSDINFKRSRSTATLSGSEEEQFYECTETDGSLDKGVSFDLESLILNDDDDWSTLDMLLDGSPADVAIAITKLDKLRNLHKNNADYYWRVAKALRQKSIIAEQEGDVDLKKSCTLDSCEAAARALEIDDTNPEVHKWCAITLGSRGDYVSTTQKIEDGKAFADHIQTAIKLKPNDFTLHHLAGRFYFEVSGLSWMERKLASMVFGDPPEGTICDALQEFLKAEELNKNSWKENKLFVAKCYLSLRKTSDALSWLVQAKDIPVKDASDEIIQTEILTLLRKHGPL